MNENDAVLPPADKPSTPGAASTAGAVSVSGTAKTTKPTTPAAPVDDALAQLRARVDRNQQAVKRSLEIFSENARTTREHNDAQFQNINASLAALLAHFPSSTSTTTSTVAASQAAGTSRSASVASDASFRGFSDTNPPPAPTVSAVSAAFANISIDAAPIARQAPRKLHSLPKFSGAPDEWPKFFMRYQQTTEAYGYSSIDNSLRLQDSLTGEALDAVDNMLNDGSHTDAVIAELESRFGRPELLAQMQLQRIREILPIPETRPELMVPYASKVANMMSYIDQPKTRQYLDNPELLEQLIQKLPLSRRHDWGKFAIGVEPFPTIRHFNTWLKEQARCVSMMTPAATLAAATLPTQTTSSARPKPAATQQRRDRVNHVATSNRANAPYATCPIMTSANVDDFWR